MDFKANKLSQPGHFKAGYFSAVDLEIDVLIHYKRGQLRGGRNESFSEEIAKISFFHFFPKI